MIYLLDTNAISDYLSDYMRVVNRVERELERKERLVICLPVYYELKRGLLKRKAVNKLTALENKLIPRLLWEHLQSEDWVAAAQSWADTQSRGQQLSDMDLLIAAIARRLDAIVVSSDNDFDALPVKREDWRESL